MTAPAYVPSTPGAPHRLSLRSALALLLAGCANPGPPHPPSLHLPAVVTDLAAERAGDTVRLSWTTPAKTTDGLRITGPITAQLCRLVPSVQASGSRPAAPPCSAVQRAPVVPGPSEIIDPLSPVLRSGAGLIEYRVEIRNTRERSAGESFPAFAAAGQAPPPVTGLRIQPAEQGALLQWQPEDAIDPIELERRNLAAPDGSKAVKTAQTDGSGTKRPLQSAASEPEVLRLRASGQDAASSPFRPDAGGTLDATARRGQTYAYTAQRIRQVVADGHTLEIRSALSPAVTVVMRDSFPPHAPAGLEAIGGTVGHPSAPVIDLSWTPNSELDLAGYLVYRQDLGEHQELAARRGRAAPHVVRLTAAPVPEPGFRDLTPIAGHSYTYAVTAVDTSGNESAPSAPAQEEVRLP